MNNQDVLAFDFETSGLRPGHHEAVSIGAKAYRFDTMEAYPAAEGGEFYSLMKPLFPENIDDVALKVNGLTREQLDKAPEQKAVWRQFIDWAKRYQKKGGIAGLPIAAGKNIRHFDLKFVRELNKLHHPKGETACIFSTRVQLDLEDFLFHWFWSEPDLPNMKMDVVRPWFGIDAPGHNALADARHTGEIISRFLKLCRYLRRRKNPDGGLFIPLKGSLKGHDFGALPCGS